MNRQRKKVATGIVVGLGVSSIITMGAVAVRSLSGPVGLSTDDGKAAKTTVSPRQRNNLVTRARADYTVIGQRNLFQSLTSERVEEKPSVVEVAAAEIQAPTTTSEPKARTPLDDGVAAIGVVQLDGVRHAVMEDFGRGETRFAREGDSAFGYKLARIESQLVTLERDGKTFRLALGENKPERGARGSGRGSAATMIAALPANLQRLADGLLPPGESRIRTEIVDGQTVYRVDRKVNGLDHELRLASDGTVLRQTHEIRHDEVPSHVQAAANSALEGFRINPNNPPEYRERNGQSYYQIEMIPAGDGRKIDLNIAADGRVLGRE